MTYDTLLALRGWGESDFRLVRPDFLEAVRFALFAERMGPELSAARGMLGQPSTVENLQTKLDSERLVKTLEPLLVPADG